MKKITKKEAARLEAARTPTQKKGLLCIECCRNCLSHHKFKLPNGGMNSIGERRCSKNGNILSKHDSKWYKCSKYKRNFKSPLRLKEDD